MVVRYDGRATSVRLLELDTPESVYPAASVQHFGPESAAFTTARLDSQTVQQLCASSSAKSISEKFSSRVSIAVGPVGMWES